MEEIKLDLSWSPIPSQSIQIIAQAGQTSRIFRHASVFSESVFSESVFSESVVSKMYFPKVYFPKINFPKVYFPKVYLS